MKMKRVEITLDDGLYRKLQKESKATSQPIERLIRNLLVQSLRQTPPKRAYFNKLLAEGYQVMAEKNATLINDSLAAQLIVPSFRRNIYAACGTHE
jgi:hypothetical protein